MSKGISRRELLKQTTTSTLAAITAPTSIVHGSQAIGQVFPPLRPAALGIPGFHAYISEQSVCAGEPVQIHVSSTVPYRLSLVRLGPAIDDRASDEEVHRFPEQLPQAQPIRPGSCLVIERGLPAEFLQADFATEVWIRPFLTVEPQAVLTQASTGGDWGLFLSESKELCYRVGTRTLLKSEPLPTLKWTHVLLVGSGGKVSLWLNGVLSREAESIDSPELLAEPLVIGALQQSDELSQFLDSDIAQPCCYQRSLSAEEIKQRFEAKGLKLPESGRADLLGCWPLGEERGEEVADYSPARRTGRIVNCATWMIGGPSFDGRNVARYGDQYDPTRDSLRGHGLRLSSDDLYDCNWAMTHEFVLPADSRPGLHCARADFELDGLARVYYLTFLVRKPATASKAPLLVLCSSSTWTAYNSTPFMKNLEANQRWFASTAGGVNVDGRAPAYSCYMNHRGGQPAYQFGLRMPWPVAGPHVLYSEPNMGYSHLMRGERFTHVWLEENGYDYDLCFDLDLHRDPGLLNGYQSVLINGHSEYWSTDSYRGLDDYLRQGGTQGNRI